MGTAPQEPDHQQQQQQQQQQQHQQQEEDEDKEQGWCGETYRRGILVVEVVKEAAGAAAGA